MGKSAFQKYEEIKALDTMRTDLLKKMAEENSTDDDSENLETLTLTESKKTYPEVNIEHEKHQRLLERIRYEAITHKEKGNVDAYEKKLIEWLALDPWNADFMKLLADLYFTIWNHKKALTLLKKILENNPEDHKAIWQIWEIYLGKNELDTAEILVEKAITLKPNDPKYYVSLVEIKYNRGQKEEAANLMEKVIKLRPNNISYLQAIAKLYEEITDLQSAKKYYFKILELEPMNDKAKAKVQIL